MTKRFVARGVRATTLNVVNLVFAIVLFNALSSASDCFAQNKNTERFRKDALPQWELLRSKILNLRGEFKETFHIAAVGGRPERTSSRQIRYWLSGTLAKFETRSVPDTGTLTVHARNLQARFAIGRDAKGSPLHVFVYSPLSQTRSGVDQTAKFQLTHLLAAFHLQGTDLADTLKQNQLTVKEISEKDGAGKVTATLTIPGEQKGGADYRVVFLPDRGWAISEWSTNAYGHASRGTMTYFDSVLDGQYPSSVVAEDLSKDGSVVARVEYTFTKPQTCDAPEEAFTLASYGLTPAGVITPTQPMATWRWLLLAINVIAVGLLLLVLWWRAYRATSANN